MKTPITGLAALALVALLHLPATVRANDPAAEAAARLAAIIAPCTDCHGVDGGSSQADIPHLDRQDIGYLIESMELLAAGQRATQVPGHIPADWSAADRRAVATHYNAKVSNRAAEAFDPDKAKIGKEIFLERCESCHENGGRERDYRGSGSAIIAQQRMAYLERQLKAFVGGQRRFLVGVKKATFLGLPIVVQGGQARERLDPIGETEVEALVHYLASNSLPVPKTGSRRIRR